MTPATCDLAFTVTTAPRSFILQLGRMVERKGVDTVIRGLVSLKRLHGIDAHLVVGGER